MNKQWLLIFRKASTKGPDSEHPTTTPPILIKHPPLIQTLIAKCPHNYQLIQISPPVEWQSPIMLMSQEYRRKNMSPILKDTKTALNLLSKHACLNKRSHSNNNKATTSVQLNSKSRIQSNSRCPSRDSPDYSFSISDK